MNDKPLVFKRIKMMYAPWLAFVVYISLTLLINFFGPWSFQNYDWRAKVLVFSFMVFFVLCGSVSYHWGLRTMRASTSRSYSMSTVEAYILKFSLMMSLGIYILLIVSAVGRRDFSLHSGFASSIAIAYNLSHAQAGLGRTWGGMLYSYGYVFCFLGKALGLYRLRELPITYKALVVTNLLAAILYALFSVGAMKPVGDVMIIVGSVIVARSAHSGILFDVRRRLLLILVLIAFSLLFASAFAARFAMWGVTVYDMSPLARFYSDHWTISWLPSGLKVGFALLSFYVSHGYYGLYLALNLPFEWAKGLGSSFVVRDLMARYFATEPLVAGVSYPERMEVAFGWSGYVHWTTIFPWLASDFTFVGAIAVLALFIRLYAGMWKQALSTDNGLSFALFSMLNIMLVYIPANNQLFQTRPVMLAFILLLIMHAVVRGDVHKHVKFRWKKEG